MKIVLDTDKRLTRIRELEEVEYSLEGGRMSYCRWSCDNYKSDIYCYYSCEGVFVIHIAGNRIVGDVPELDYRLILGKKYDEYEKAALKRSEFIEKAEKETINLPYAGESFCEPTAKDTVERLMELREIGYYVPQHAIDSLNEEVE